MFKLFAKMPLALAMSLTMMLQRCPPAVVIVRLLMDAGRNPVFQYYRNRPQPPTNHTKQETVTKMGAHQCAYDTIAPADAGTHTFT